ncbi:hypothetical protein Pcinc_017356 [Petrolisthes cinctipes]|uniref:Uncharacterized protein n=1 Tax=Petrolisthes cinctipes TaxID=88211 RepID=A0AAE1FUA4_PETCI|nr:hypothetical protein Pcinc_017356 [Petrolisthes cinctipes]
MCVVSSGSHRKRVKVKVRTRKVLWCEWRGNERGTKPLNFCSCALGAGVWAVCGEHVEGEEHKIEEIGVNGGVAKEVGSKGSSGVRARRKSVVRRVVHVITAWQVCAVVELSLEWPSSTAPSLLKAARPPGSHVIWKLREADRGKKVDYGISRPESLGTLSTLAEPSQLSLGTLRKVSAVSTRVVVDTLVAAVRGRTSLIMWHESSNLANLPGGRPPRCTTPAQDRDITAAVEANAHSNTVTIRETLHLDAITTARISMRNDGVAIQL